MNPQLLKELTRAIFPRWSFFDRIDHSMVLEYKLSETDPWTILSFDRPRKYHHLLINPHTNLALAHKSLIEIFARDYQEFETTELTSYKLVVSMVAGKLEAQTFQFRIVARRVDDETEIYRSGWVS